MTESIIKNAESFKILLHAFETSDSSSEFKTDLIHTIRAIFNIDKQSTIITVGPEIDPFRVFFLQFDNMSLSNKKLILTMLEEVLLLRDIKYDELKAYCCLLQGKRPSTLLLVTQHMLDLLHSERISRDPLRKCGILSILNEYLVTPTEYPCIDVLTNDIDEVKLCLILLESHNTVDNLSNMSVRINEILYGISLKMLLLLITLLQNNLENQIQIREK